MKRKLNILHLEYNKIDGTYQHYDSDRKAVFVGDYIDRGPEIRETLSIVKSMVSNDSAYALLGNHEYNALCYNTSKDGQTNSWLRRHSKKNEEQHIETIRQFKNHKKEWEEYLSWFMDLPLFLILNYNILII